MNHEIGGIGGRDGGRFPKSAVSELEVKTALPRKNNLEGLLARGARLISLIRGVRFREDLGGLHGWIQNPAVSGRKICGKGHGERNPCLCLKTWLRAKEITAAQNGEGTKQQQRKLTLEAAKAFQIFSRSGARSASALAASAQLWSMRMAAWT